MTKRDREYIERHLELAYIRLVAVVTKEGKNERAEAARLRCADALADLERA